MHTYLASTEVFQYFPSLSYSAWHKPECLQIRHDLFALYNLAILNEDLKIHDFILTNLEYHSARTWDKVYPW